MLVVRNNCALRNDGCWIVVQNRVRCTKNPISKRIEGTPARNAQALRAFYLRCKPCRRACDASADHRHCLKQSGAPGHRETVAGARQYLERSSSSPHEESIATAHLERCPHDGLERIRSRCPVDNGLVMFFVQFMSTACRICIAGRRVHTPSGSSWKVKLERAGQGSGYQDGDKRLRSASGPRTRLF